MAERRIFSKISPNASYDEKSRGKGNNNQKTTVMSLPRRTLERKIEMAENRSKHKITRLQIISVISIKIIDIILSRRRNRESKYSKIP